MKNQKHTQGQWLLESSGLTEFQFSIETNDNSTEIARVGTLEDAKLMAAAPELLKALQSIEILCREKPKDPNQLKEWMNGIEAEAYNAIQKATK